LKPNEILRQVAMRLRRAEISGGFITYELAWTRYRGKVFCAKWQGHVHGCIVTYAAAGELEKNLGSSLSKGPTGARPVVVREIEKGTLARVVNYCLKLGTCDSERYRTWKGWDVEDHAPQSWMSREHAEALSEINVSRLIKLISIPRAEPTLQPVSLRSF
jgi:hypothetical protein